MSLTAGRPKLKLRGLLSRGEALKVYFPLGVYTDRQRNDSAVCTGRTAESENPSRPAGPLGDRNFVSGRTAESEFPSRGMYEPKWEMARRFAR